MWVLAGFAPQAMLGATMDYRLLVKVPLFDEMPVSQLQELASQARAVELAPGALLFEEGDRGECFYIVHEGELEVFQMLEAQEERILAVRRQGEWVGELALLNPDELRTASVRARSAAKLWEIRREQFDAVMQRLPQLAYKLIRGLSARMTAAQEATIRDLRQKNAELVRAYEDLKAAQAQIIEKERLERELEVARDIQMSILPHQLPHLPGYDFGARMVPARAVGGDFYDLIQLTDNEVAVLVGDVTGKGVPAAIFMAQIHALLHAGARLLPDPIGVLQWVNDQLLESGGSMLFATVLYGILDRRTGEFAFARAGHEPPILALSGGETEVVPWTVGQPLGLLEDPDLEEQRMTIPPEASLLIYSDGVNDSCNPAGESFGRDALAQVFGRLHGSPGQAVCDRLWETLLSFQGDAPQFDDVTLVAIHSLAGGTAPRR
jgi:sigma-B regulation protein RsbU (phosphoserine phosphatase)